MSLHVYTGHAGTGCGEVLVFAHNGREARPLAFMGITSKRAIDYSAVRVQRIRKPLEHVRNRAVPAHVAADRAHVVIDQVPA